MPTQKTNRRQVITQNSLCRDRNTICCHEEELIITLCGSLEKAGNRGSNSWAHLLLFSSSRERRAVRKLSPTPLHLHPRFLSENPCSICLRML